MNGIEKYKIIREFFDEHKSEYVLTEGVEKAGNFIFASNDRDKVIGVAEYYLSQNPTAILFLNYFSVKDITGHSQNLNVTDLINKKRKL